MHSTLSKVFFSVSKDNDFNEDRIGTITSEFRESELDTDRIRTVADELSLSSLAVRIDCSPDIFTV